MPDTKKANPSVPEEFFAPKDQQESAIPIWFVRADKPLEDIPDLDEQERRWLHVTGFTGAAKKTALIPGPEGAIRGVAFGIGSGQAGEPSGPSELLIGTLANTLPPATYRLADTSENAELAAIAWGLGAYRFRSYKSAKASEHPRLVVPDNVDLKKVLNQVEAVWLGRNLINTPAEDMGPADIQHAIAALGEPHGAKVSTIIGDDLLAERLPMIHAVGRAATQPRAPRLVDLRWQKPGGKPDAPKITLVGKGIAFDTGGLDIKPAAAMLLMKKDMGGASAATTLASMIMAEGLDVRLRLLVPAAENSISGDAFRPGDILTSRAGHSVEVGNTDAEGRLVLADAISLADEEEPDMLLVFATLTGAARVALGPDLPAFFTNDDDFASALTRTGRDVGDPMWRLPLWPGYERSLDSDIADFNNVGGSFAGAITAALFLKRFVRNARRFAHFDLYGWRPTSSPLGPKGGEPHTARALLAQLQRELTA